MNKISKKKILKIALSVFSVLAIIAFLMNCYVVLSVRNRVIYNDDYKNIKDVDCIIILGAGIRGEKPSPLLQDRLDKGIELYFEGVAPKIILSGDHGKKDHDEVNVMKEYAIEKGVPSEDIFMDHAGFSTYDTMYRAKNVFGVKKAIIVTQKYHIYRSLYIANKIGIDAYGVPTLKKRKNAIFREIREVLARGKDLIKVNITSSNNYKGETISINQSGDVTNDK